MAPRITTYRELFAANARRYPDRADWVCIYIPNGRKPIRLVIGPPGEESLQLARAGIEQALQRQLGEAQGFAPLFADAATRYCELGVRFYQLADSTVPLQVYRVKAFSKRWEGLRLDQIGLPELTAWWEDHVLRGGHSPETGKRWLSALSAVYRYHAAHAGAAALPNPVQAFLQTITKTGTKAHRAKLEDTARPIETGKELRALEDAIRAHGDPDVMLIYLLMLDHGERRGEVFGARPVDMELGTGPDDQRRLVYVRKNRPGSKRPQAPKSGKPRAVPMSRRLREHLRQHYALWPAEQPLTMRFQQLALKRAEKRSGSSERDGADYFQRTVFAELTKRAGIGRRVPKDLRDTFASHLLSAGFPQLQIMRWIGHAPTSVGMFRQRYARWLGDEWVYREPEKLAPGEVPTDLFGRLVAAAATATSAR